MGNNSLVPSMTFKNLVPWELNIPCCRQDLFSMHGYIPAMKLHFMDCTGTAALPSKQMFPLPSVQPLTKGRIRYTFRQSQLSIAGPNHQQFCHKAQQLWDYAFEMSFKMEIVECIRAHPMPLFFDRFPDFLCVQGLWIRNYLIPALPLVSCFLKEAATICHEDYRNTFFSYNQAIFNFYSCNCASTQADKFFFYFIEFFSLSYKYLNIIE